MGLDVGALGAYHAQDGVLRAVDWAEEAWVLFDSRSVFEDVVRFRRWAEGGGFDVA